MSARTRGLVVLGLLIAGTSLATGVGSAADPGNSRWPGAVAAPSHTDLAYFSTDPVSRLRSSNCRSFQEPRRFLRWLGRPNLVSSCEI